MTADWCHDYVSRDAYSFWAKWSGLAEDLLGIRNGSIIQLAVRNVVRLTNLGNTLRNFGISGAFSESVTTPDVRRSLLATYTMCRLCCLHGIYSYGQRISCFRDFVQGACSCETFTNAAGLLPSPCNAPASSW